MGWKQAATLLTLMWFLPLVCRVDANGVIQDDWGIFGSCETENHHYFDGTVLEMDEDNKQFRVEITDSKWSHFTDGDQVIIDYGKCNQKVSEISPKKGMYISITYWEDKLKPRKNGIACLEADDVEKNISFVNGKWSEGTYD